MKNVEVIRRLILEKYLSNEFVIDADGGKLVELVGESFIADEPSIFGSVNREYVQKELDWYECMSLNVFDMPDPPQIWKMIADKQGYINSNYGWCIYSRSNNNQYLSVLSTLKNDKSSRRGSMIYTRPSMQSDYNKNGMSDFMCTNAANYFIRNNRLSCVVQMRSNDVWAGYRNDSAWHKYVLNKLLEDLRKTYEDLELGDVIWNSASLHVYEKNFYLLEHYHKTGDVWITKKQFKEMHKNA